MPRYISMLSLSLLGIFISITNAADCRTNQQRHTGDPSGDDIATALTKDAQLSSVCSGNFPPGNDRIATYNHWSMIYNVTRDDPSQDLQSCQDGFQNVIDQCISGGNYWGGKWSLNGFTYSIYNKAYPLNGLGPNDKEGSSSSGGASTSGPSSTTNSIIATTSDRGTTPRPTTTAPSVSGGTIVTETNSDGSPIVATFAPTTLSQYATLRSKTTITTTATREGVPVIFPLVVGVGGVAWGVVGAPPPGITPPNGSPGDGEGNGGDHPTTNSNNPTSTVSTSSTSTSSSTSSTAALVTAIGDRNYDDWQSLNQIPIQPNGPTPDGDDFGPATSSAAGSTATTATTATTSTAPSNPTSTIAVFPTGLDVNCLTAQPFGARMIDCFGMLAHFRPDQKICTNDPDACLASGDSYCKATGGSCDLNASGTDVINTSNYCMLAQSSGCAFVIANKQNSFGGFPGSSCVTGAQMDQYIRGAANKCAGEGTIALQVGPDVSNGVRQDTYCLLGEEGPGVCGA
ncbi:MAG: hypothetical protein Q9200_007195 [Gallowayella weberi]